MWTCHLTMSACVHAQPRLLRHDATAVRFGTNNVMWPTWCKAVGHRPYRKPAQTLECKTKQKHIRICIMSHGVKTHFQSSKPIQYHITHVPLPSKSPLPIPQLNSDHGARISVPVNETYLLCTHMIICSYVHMSHLSVAHMLTWQMSHAVCLSHIAVATPMHSGTQIALLNFTVSVRIHQLQQAILFCHTAS